VLSRWLRRLGPPQLWLELLGLWLELLELWLELLGQRVCISDSRGAGHSYGANGGQSGQPDEFTA